MSRQQAEPRPRRSQGCRPRRETSQSLRWLLCFIFVVIFFTACDQSAPEPRVSAAPSEAGPAVTSVTSGVEPAEDVDAFIEQLPTLIDQRLTASALSLPDAWPLGDVRLRWRDLIEGFYQERAQAPLFVDSMGLNKRGFSVMQTLSDVESHALDPEVFHLGRLHAQLDALLVEQAMVIPGDFALDENARAKLRSWGQKNGAISGEERLALVLDLERSPTPTLARRYHDRLEARATLATQLQRLELMLIDGALSYAHDMRLGNPQDADDAQRLALGDEAIVRGRMVEFIKKLDASAVDPLLASLTPPWPQYDKLRFALRRYRKIEAAGGWPTLEVPKRRLPVRRGAKGPTVEALQRRLQVEGYYSGEITGRFGKDVKRALIAYQTAHQLSEDGELEADDLASLNVSARERAAQIEVTLERWRHSRIGADDYYIFVNIPDFHGELWRGGERVHRFRVIVGSSGRYHDRELDRWVFSRATPELSSKMRQIVFNPYWHVPEGIRRTEHQEKLAEDPDYYEKNNFEVITRGSYTQVRQKPGPDNALGQVKFLFPNPHSVYMHDTPDRNLFRHGMRAFSHGCVRVHEPLKLAEVLMKQDGHDHAEYSVKSHAASGRNGSYNLKTPIPVHIEYFVVRVHDDGKAHFGADIYRYDRPRVDAQLATVQPEDPEPPSR